MNNEGERDQGGKGQRRTHRRFLDEAEDEAGEGEGGADRFFTNSEIHGIYGSSSKANGGFEQDGDASELQVGEEDWTLLYDRGALTRSLPEGIYATGTFRRRKFRRNAHNFLQE